MWLNLFLFLTCMSLLAILANAILTDRASGDSPFHDATLDELYPDTNDDDRKNSIN
jgi:hypothetical protein